MILGRNFFLRIALLFACVLFFPARSILGLQAGKARSPSGGVKTIMAMGDSITMGYSGNPDSASGAFGANYGGYRGALQVGLYKNGCGFDFVGRSAFYGNLLGDKESEGYGGYTLSDLQNVAQTALPQFSPDIVLFMGGTNDMYDVGKTTVWAAAAQLSETIQTMFSVAPNLSLYVALIPPVNNSIYPNNKIDAYNALIPDIAASFAARGFNITIVDQQAALSEAIGPLQENWFTYFGDGEHPLQAGYDLIAKTWLDAILAHGDCVNPPAFEVASLPIKPNAENGAPETSECLVNAGRKPDEDGYTPFARNTTSYGGAFRLNNFFYSHGLGQQAFSRQCFDVSPVCNIFHAQIGLDDMSPGTFTEFRVFADDVLIYTSPEMDASSETITLDIPVPAGAKMITLESGPNTNKSTVYADWVNARMTCPASSWPTPALNKNTFLPMVGR